MDYEGLMQKFKVNRPLTDEERANHLKQKQRLDVEPIYQLAVTRLNSTYLESVDKYFGWKGFATFFLLAVLLLMLVGLVTVGMGLVVAPQLPRGNVLRETFDPNQLYEGPEVGLFFLVVVIFAPVIALAVWGLCKESFAYTHYPVRLNRKSRMVYVFRRDGTVLAAKWDDLFFTLGRGAYLSYRQEWDIRGHVLAPDGQTVLETFAFSHHNDDKSFLLRHWEFLRRYMEDGPQGAAALVKIFMGVTDRRETAKQSFYRMWLNFGFGHAVGFLMLPLAVLMWLGRLFAMRTSKVPVWTAEVEAACAIEPGDPYERDERNNPPDMYSFAAREPSKAA